jgi:hypothetical protein
MVNGILVTSYIIICAFLNVFGLEKFVKDKMCKSCGFVGQPTSQGMDSFLVDILLWLAFTSVAMMFALFPLLLIPLAWTIYHIATYWTITCPKCENLDMVRVDARNTVKVSVQTQEKTGSWSEAPQAMPVYQDKLSSQI